MDNNERTGYPTEQPAVRTTIVGGRPPGPGKGVGSVPRGIEVLTKKAAVDEEFKDLLLAERSAAADAISLELNEAEAAMLDGIPEVQLEGIIANTTVNPKLRPAFMGRAAAVMLAALGVTVAAADAYPEYEAATGARPDYPDEPEPYNVSADGQDADQTGDVAEEEEEAYNLTRGISPDYPPEKGE
ncbi:MAG: hypothetical protein JSW52_02480 [Candidatus Coatesbacteria bacterium]|nr:MAG: hypothetical protein JSW52_02480 [Candidatus Coatesbacteria bacterium]